MLTYNPQIKRTPPDEKRLAKKRNEEEAQRQAEVEYSLDLVPFGSVTHIPFEKIKYGEAAVRTVVIRNPSAKNVQVSRTPIIKEICSKESIKLAVFFSRFYWRSSLNPKRALRSTTLISFWARKKKLKSRLDGFPKMELR